MGLKTFFSGLFNAVDNATIACLRAENSQLKNRVKDRDDLLEQYRAELEQKGILLSTQASELGRLELLLTQANGKIEELMAQLGVEVEVDAPAWLDRATTCYQPRAFYNGETVLFPPTWFYSIPDEVAKLVKNKGWGALPFEEKLLAIWKYVAEEYRYVHDKEENWQPPLTTFVRTKGDCEDTTILFVTLCRAAGVPANRVFNACGTWVGIGGHSFPVVKRDDGNWWVYETTINGLPSNKQPMRWLNSPYQGEFGLANWKFQGRLKSGVQV